MKQSLFLTLFLAIGLTLFACKNEDDAPTDPQAGKEVVGKVKDEIGGVYPNVVVQLFKGAQILETKSNSTGNFGFDVTEAGTYQITISPPLSSMVISADTVTVEVQLGSTATVDFTLQVQTLEALVVMDSIDIFGEIRNEAGDVPSSPDEEIYARNVFDDPIGLLTPIKTPSDHHLTLGEWSTAQGNIKATCDGNKTSVEINLEGMIPNGTYTFWCDFLNKVKLPGQFVHFAGDVISIEPLGSGTLNVVKADANGVINKTISHTSCMLTREIALVMVIDYHINGNTFGTAHIPDEEDVTHMLVYFQ